MHDAMFTIYCMDVVFHWVWQMKEIQSRLSVTVIIGDVTETGDTRRSVIVSSPLEMTDILLMSR
jgi:hypothetical protein